ncbi:MAG: hypothetical protein IVW57_16940, partial [Ktedonobacterales bacterium]|nr:hypothetical protein [Ktedonobacterales bacterium]
SRLMVEPAQQNIIEVNCSVLGSGADARPSVCEQPIGQEGVLSYQDKYLGGAKGGGVGAKGPRTGAKGESVNSESAEAKRPGMQSARRIIPAPLEPALTEAIQAAAVRAFAAIGATGVARVDFLLRPADGIFYVNEINTLPGSLSFYLWEPAGVPFPELLATLIDLAQARQREKRRTTYSFSSSLLSANPLLGVKADGNTGVSPSLVP